MHDCPDCMYADLTVYSFDFSPFPFGADNNKEITHTENLEDYFTDTQKNKLGWPDEVVTLDGSPAFDGRPQS